MKILCNLLLWRLARRCLLYVVIKGLIATVSSLYVCMIGAMDVEVPSTVLDAVVMSSWPDTPPTVPPPSRRSASMDWKGRICSTKFSILRERSVSWITRLRQAKTPKDRQADRQIKFHNYYEKCNQIFKPTERIPAYPLELSYKRLHFERGVVTAGSVCSYVREYSYAMHSGTTLILE